MCLDVTEKGGSLVGFRIHTAENLQETTSCLVCSSIKEGHPWLPEKSTRNSAFRTALCRTLAGHQPERHVQLVETDVGIRAL